MPHLLTLPREVRDLIYAFYLEGLTIYLHSTEPLEVSLDKRSWPWRASFRHGGMPNVLALTRVNRQVYAELDPKVASSTLLILGDECLWS